MLTTPFGVKSRIDRELAVPGTAEDRPVSYWANRKLRPEFARLQAEGANRLEQKRVARECAEWIRQRVDIRSVRHAQLLHGKMYHIANGPAPRHSKDFAISLISEPGTVRT